MPLWNLSPAQESAVRYISSPAIVTAGAGSGKTRTLTHKIAYLVNELNYGPGKILAITFTNKAAAEMKNRLREATGMPPEEFPWVRTFHSACFKILREHCELLGYRKPLLIHDESQQAVHLKKVLDELDLDRKYLYQTANMISKAKNSGDPVRYLNGFGNVPRKHEIYRLYNERLELSNCVDFDDILLLARDLLRKFPDIQARYQNRFDYILVDEFQDSNDIQNQIIDLLLRNGNLTVVGDDYQSIYRFRGADPAHFINFPDKYANARIFRLEENFRSTDQIVEASDALISYNSRRIEKSCYSVRAGDAIQVQSFLTEEDEAEWVAGKCRRYANSRKIPLDRIAILFRTKFTSLPFERAFRFAKLPYIMVGAQGFFQRREVQDVNAYLICGINKRDDVSFERIINAPRRGIGPTALKKILECREPGMALQDACKKALERKSLPKKAMGELNKLLSFVDSLETEKPDAAIRRVMEEMGYEQYLANFSDSSDDYQSRLENINQMIYDAARKETIAEYLEDAALMRDDQDVSAGVEGIRLSTIHAAKGLEFKAVFVVALEERVLPHYRSIYMEDGGGDGGQGIEEERRLMYVAMTRASDHLHLTWAMSRRGEPAERSRFLEEIPEHLLA